MTTEVSSSLINVMLHEKNKVNLVIPETQVIMMSEEERNALLKLYNRIDNESAVSIDIESACCGRRSRVDSSSTLFIQLYLLSACALLNNCVEKIFFRNVAMTEEVLAIVLAILRRYVVCNRCQKVKSVSFISTRAALR